MSQTHSLSRCEAEAVVHSFLYFLTSTEEPVEFGRTLSYYGVTDDEEVIYLVDFVCRTGLPNSGYAIGIEDLAALRPSWTLDQLVDVLTNKSFPESESRPAVWKGGKGGKGGPRRRIEPTVPWKDPWE